MLNRWPKFRGRAQRGFVPKYPKCTPTVPRSRDSPKRLLELRRKVTAGLMAIGNKGVESRFVHDDLDHAALAGIKPCKRFSRTQFPNPVGKAPFENLLGPTHWGRWNATEMFPVIYSSGPWQTLTRTSQTRTAHRCLSRCPTITPISVPVAAVSILTHILQRPA